MTLFQFSYFTKRKEKGGGKITQRAFSVQKKVHSVPAELFLAIHITTERIPGLGTNTQGFGYWKKASFY